VDLSRIVLSTIVPPLEVFWQVGLTSQFWFNNPGKSVYRR